MGCTLGRGSVALPLPPLKRFQEAPWRPGPLNNFVCQRNSGGRPALEPGLQAGDWCRARQNLPGRQWSTRPGPATDASGAASGRRCVPLWTLKNFVQWYTEYGKGVGSQRALCHLDRLVQWYTEYGRGVGLDVLAPSDAVVCQQKAVCGASQQKAVCGMPRGRFGRFALLKVY